MMKLNVKQHVIYNWLISLCAVASSVFIIIDFVDGLQKWQLHLNRFIFVIFLVDSVLRIANAPDKKKYIQHNFWDLYALLPFHGVFVALPFATPDKILLILNLTRIIAFLVRPLRKLKPILDTNGFKYVLIASVGIVILGGVLIHFAEGMTFSDGIWWSFVTATTVGYGDLSPSTVYGRIIAMILMLLGIGLIGSLTSAITSFFMKQSSTKVKDKVLEQIINQLNHFDDLSKEDIDDICEILKTMKKRQHK